ncbi:MAG: hypothetical protein DWQ37_01065 [Planctomycetota bacterium]|nr:MAG: hypothetical protein DWQ37_01065 [Planctomycetota bacterium]
MDRIARSLFVALAVGLGWGIRGDFGHLLGAMYPGACLALGLAYVSRQRSLFLWMPILGLVSALGIGSGGSMSYGILHGYAKADTFINYSYGYLTLFLQGSAWGTFGGAIIGLVLERKQLRTVEWLGWLGSLLAGGWLASMLIVRLAGFDINPPRNNTSITFMGAAIGQIIWLAANGRSSGLRGAVLGYIGFGLGMAGGRLLGNFTYLPAEWYGFSVNHWNVMEVTCGLVGGFIYTFGMVNRAYPEPPEKENVPLVSFFGIVFVLGIIPLWHRISRIRPDEKLEEWSQRLASYDYPDPEAMSESVLSMLNGVCVLGFIGAAIWMLIHFKRWQPLAWFPVIWLSLTMVLFQNINALYFWYPTDWQRFNMHGLFWGMWGTMLAYVIVSPLFKPQPAPEPTEDDPEPSFPYARWVAGTLVALALIIFAAGFVNGEKTMQSANTRWPLWNWRDGPFPR